MSDIKNKKVIIAIDQTAAENALQKLQLQADKLNKKIQEGRDAGKSMTSELKKLEDVTSSMKKVQDQIDKGLRPSIAQQNTLVTQLRNELKRMSEDAPGYAQKFQSFQKATAELNRMRDAMNGAEKAQSNWFQQAKVVAFGVLIGNTVQAMIQSITGYVSGIVSGNAKLSDSLADIRRVAGLTANEATELNKKLGQIDTRTSVAGLREIAIIAGKLGVAKDDIASFTESVDKLVVALGDELGNADEITTELGKILNVFDGKVNGDNILRLGNAIVELANAGVASGPFITDFTQRMAGIAKTSNLSLAATVGLGAGLEELGQKSESSSTAISKLLSTIAQDIPAAAKIAGAKTKEEIQNFANLFASAPQEALIKYAEGLSKNKQSFAEISKAFKDAGDDGARVIATLATIGQKGDFLREKIDLAGKSLQNTNAINEAFAIKNETLGAELDKLGKKFTAFIQSSTISEFFRGAVAAASGFIDVLKAVPKFLTENKTAIGLLVLGIATMNGSYIAAAAATIKDTIAKTANAFITKATAIANNIATAATAAYIVITNLLTARITLATAAQRLWNIAMSLGAGPIGAIIVAAGALTLALGNLIGATKKITAEQLLQADVQAKLVDTFDQQKSKLENLASVAQNVNLSYENRKQALDALIAQNPEYLSGLTLENINTQKGIDIINDYIDSLGRLAKAKALVDIKADLEKQRLTQDIDLNAKQQAAKNESFASDFFGTPFGLSANSKYKNALEENVETTTKFNIATNQINDSISKLNFSISVQQDKLSKLKKGTDEYTAAERTLNSLIKERNIYQGLPQDAGLNQPQTNVTVTGGLTEDELKKQEEALQNFQDFMKAIQDSMLENQIPAKAKAIIDILQKTRDELQKLDEFKKTAGLSAQQVLDAQAQIYQQQKTAIQKIVDDENKDLTVSKLVNESALKDLPLHLSETIDKLPKAVAELPIKFMPPDFSGDLKKKFDEELKNFMERFQRDQKAGYQLDVLTAGSPGEKRDALLNQLQYEHDQELLTKNLTDNERLVLEAEYQDKRRQIYQQYTEEIVQEIQAALDFASRGLDLFTAFDQIKANRENADLRRDQQINDSKKKALKARLDQNLISQKEYDNEVAKLDNEADAKKQALEKKQFERNKRQQIIEAGISGAQAVMTDIKNYGAPIPPNFLSIAAVAFDAGLTIAKIAAISSAKYALGGKTKGPSHAENGLPVINPQTGQKVAELEGDEGILKKSAMRSKNTYTVSGTPSQIASTLNAMYGGVRWDSNAIVKPRYQTRPYVPVNYAGITKTMQRMKFAEGGVFGVNSGSPQIMTADPVLLATLQQSQEINIGLAQTIVQLKQRLDEPIYTTFSLAKYDQARQQQQSIKDNATFK